MVKYDEKSCGLILFRKETENLFLLLHYPGGHWDFPKGHIEPNETEEQTAIRELTEETGITDITIIPGFREPMDYKYLRAGKPSHKQVVYFLAETSEQDIKISHEHQGHIWLPYDQALNHLTFDNAKNLLTKAKNHL